MSGFYTIDNDIIDTYGKAMGPYGIAVYNVIARHADKNGGAFPSYQLIEEKTDISRPKVASTIKHLVSLGLIEKENRFRPNGDMTSNHYKLVRAQIPPVVNDVNQVVNDVNYPSSPQILPVVNDVNSNNTHIEQDQLNKTNEGVDDLTETSQPPAPTPTLAQADVDEFVNATNLPAHAPSPTSGAPPSRIVLTDSPSGPKTVPRVNGVVTSRFFDPRKLVDGLIPEGSGTNPVEVFLEFFEIGPNGCGLTKPQMKALGEAITDLDKWRGVCKTVSLRNGKAYNIENMLDIYLNGFRKESVRHDDRKQLATAEERTAAIIAKRPELAAYAHFK